jgi:hypothetical protein
MEVDEHNDELAPQMDPRTDFHPGRTAMHQTMTNIGVDGIMIFELFRLY